MKFRTIVFLAASLMICASLASAAKTITVKASSDSEARGFEAYRAMDGNPSTMWHSTWGAGETELPHDLVIDLEKDYDVSGFVYVPRSGHSNGTIKDYEFYISNDIKKLGKPVSKGTFTGKKPEYSISFPAAKGRYICLRAMSEVNNNAIFASVAELRILSKDVDFKAVAGASPLPGRKPAPDPVASPVNEAQAQYNVLLSDLKKRKRFTQYKEQTFHEASSIAESDRDPLDIILRRTRTLLDDIKEMPKAPTLKDLEGQLADLEKQASEADAGDASRRQELFDSVHAVRRKIAFSNPLLDFDKILFIKRQRARYNHMCDQYYGTYAVPGGGVFVLANPFSEKPEEKNILEDSIVQRGRLNGQKLETGGFLSPELSYDGKTIYFAYVEGTGNGGHVRHLDHANNGHWDRGRCYHLFKANVDGSGLEQLTDGTFNDFDPHPLPNGRVMFISERRGGYLRCGRACPTYTVFDMLADGSGIKMLSPHETNEWHPSVTHDGMILYTRWDYVDRHGCTVHLPWIMTPDGRDSAAVHGNYAPRKLRPDMEVDLRAIPGSHRFTATAAPHHGQAYGSIVMVDPRVEDDDAMAPVKRITPDVAFPESQGGAQVYGTAWPLSEKYHLCVYDPGMKPGAGFQGRQHTKGNYGIYLLDAFGNKILLYRDTTVASLSPMPLRSREMPPVVPEASERLAENPSETGTMAVLNVYDTRRPFPEGTKIKNLRIYQIIPMSVPSGGPPHEIGLRLPTGRDSVILARYVLGTVPVEEDGSAHFTIPAMKEVFFQALDEDGLAVQSMRSSAWVQPGERLVCSGCHEPKYRAPIAPTKMAMAMKRPPSVPKPDVDGSNPFSYPRLVQPVLDKHCVKCHEKNQTAKKKPPLLDGTVVNKGRNKFFNSYHNLAQNYGFWQYGEAHRTIPGKFGARHSKLYQMLKAGHHKLELPEEDMHRITLWLDSCSVFYGVYEKDGGLAQLRGEVAKPTLE